MRGSRDPGRKDRSLGGVLDPVVLDDGTALEVRQLTSRDGPELERAIEGLSEESRYLRFFGPLPRVPQRLLDQLVSVDHVHQEALVVFEPVTRDGVAVARFAEEPDDPGVVEVAFTVDDPWQGRGIGSVLLERILRRARDTGHRAAHALVLAENRKSVEALEHAGFKRFGPPGPTVDLELPLGPPSP
jgi:GNAT superfamily N-acetyltransferase